MAAQCLARGKITVHPDYAKRRGPSDATLLVPTKADGGAAGEGGGEGGHRLAVEGLGEGREGGKVAFYFPLHLLAKHSPSFPSPPTSLDPETPRPVRGDGTPCPGVQVETSKDKTLGERLGDRVLWITPHQVRLHPPSTPGRPLPRPPSTPSRIPRTPRSSSNSIPHYQTPKSSFDTSASPYPGIQTSSRFSQSVASTPHTLRRPAGPRPMPRPPSQPEWVVGKVIDLPEASVEGLAMILDAILFDEGIEPLLSRSVTFPSPSPFRRPPASPPVSQVGRSDSGAGEDEDDMEVDEEVASSITPSTYRSPPFPSSTSASSGSTIKPPPSGSSTPPEEKMQDEVTRDLQEAYSTAKAYSFPLRLIFNPLDLGSTNPWVEYALSALSHLGSFPLSATSTRLLKTPGGIANVYVDSAPATGADVWKPSPEMKKHSTRSLAFPLSSLPSSISGLLQTHYPPALSKLLDLHTPWEAAKSISLAFFHAPLPSTPFAFPHHPRGFPCDAKVSWQDFSAARWEVRRIVWSWIMAELGEAAEDPSNGSNQERAQSGGTAGGWRTRFITPWDLDAPLRDVVGCRICREALVIECHRAIRLQWPGHPTNPLFGTHPRSV